MCVAVWSSLQLRAHMTLYLSNSFSLLLLLCSILLPLLFQQTPLCSSCPTSASRPLPEGFFSQGNVFSLSEKIRSSTPFHKLNAATATNQHQYPSKYLCRWKDPFNARCFAVDHPGHNCGVAVRNLPADEWFVRCGSPGKPGQGSDLRSSASLSRSGISIAQFVTT